MNQLQAMALNEGGRRKKGLRSKQGGVRLESFRLAPRVTRRRQDLLKLDHQFTPNIEELTAAVSKKLRGYRRCNGCKVMLGWLRSRPWPMY